MLTLQQPNENHVFTIKISGNHFELVDMHEYSDWGSAEFAEGIVKYKANKVILISNEETEMEMKRLVLKKVKTVRGYGFYFEDETMVLWKVVRSKNKEFEQRMLP